MLQFMVSVRAGTGNGYCIPVADSGGGGGGGGGGVRGVQMHPPLPASMYFCLNNCTSPSNDYTAVECNNNDQAQLNTHVSVPY